MARQRINPSVKIALGLIAFSAIAYGGYNTYVRMRLNRNFPDITPDRVAMIAVTPGKGYKIIVANRVAQLAEVATNFGSTTEQDSRNEDASATNPKRIPIREMLQALAGDAKGLTKVITRMNDLEGEGQLPTTQLIWKIEDVEKALNGDPALKTKLETELNTRLDGSPLDKIDLDAIENGIVIEVPVPVKVLVAGKETTITGTVRQWYRTSFCKGVEKRYSDKAEVTPEILKGVYLDEASKILKGTEKKQDIARSIRGLYAEGIIKGWALGPENLLSNTKILVNSTHIKNASFAKDTHEGAEGTYTLNLTVDDEGRDRLWKFSSENPGFQLLFIVDGIAIAAPRISTELAQHEVQVSNLRDADVLQEATDTVNGLAKK